MALCVPAVQTPTQISSGHADVMHGNYALHVVVLLHTLVALTQHGTGPCFLTPTEKGTVLFPKLLWKDGIAPTLLRDNAQV